MASHHVMLSRELHFVISARFQNVRAAWFPSPRALIAQHGHYADRVCEEDGAV